VNAIREAITKIMSKVEATANSRTFLEVDIFKPYCKGTQIRLTLEFTCAGLVPDDSIKDNFAAQPRLIRSQD